jgi:monoamine oxidase
MCDWGKVPWIWGAYTMPGIRELPDARALLAAPVDGVMFFAGEATDPYSFMTAHAAMQTGQRAAHEAMQAVVNRRMRDVLSLHAIATFDIRARL